MRMLHGLVPLFAVYNLTYVYGGSERKTSLMNTLGWPQLTLLLAGAESLADSDLACELNCRLHNSLAKL